MERYTIFERSYDLASPETFITPMYVVERNAVKNRDEVIRMANKMISDFRWTDSMIRVEYDVVLTRENGEQEIIHTVSRTSRK